MHMHVHMHLVHMHPCITHPCTPMHTHAHPCTYALRTHAHRCTHAHPMHMHTQGREMLAKSRTSILDDFSFYD